MGLNISLLETFTLVADLGSFSGAARRQNLSQPAVSHKIKALEKELGAALIDRSGGKVLLTPAGRTAYRHAKEILKMRDAMMADIPRATGEVAGRLLIGASTIPGEYLLPPIIGEFKGEYPGVAVSLDISDSVGVVENLKLDEVELGFVGTRVNDADISQKRFGEDRLVLITPPHHPLAAGRRVTAESLAGVRFVNRKPGSGTRLRMEAMLSEKKIPLPTLDVAAEMGSTQAVISAVQSGMGVSMVSDEAARQPARQGLIAMIDMAGVDLSREFFVIHSKEMPLSVAAERFLKLALSRRHGNE